MTPARLAVLAAAALLAACAPPGGGLPPARPAATSTPLIRPTLPPTWTPTHTATAAPPTATATPSPAPTLTPTLSAARLCASLWLVTNLRDGAIYASDARLTLLAYLPAADARLRFAATHRQTGGGRGVELPGGRLVGWQYAVARLGDPGRYVWTLSVRSDRYGDICQQQGSFWVQRRPLGRPDRMRPR